MIIAKSLSKQFNKRFVLDDLNLEIKKGENVVFVGRNGSGKTTFIRCLLGLYTYQGDLSVDGLSPRKDRVKLLSRVGYVPQTSPPINMMVLDLINYIAKLSGKTSAAIIEAARSLQLNMENDDIHKNFMKLSGGMKQKLMIAIAVGRGADIIVMDEPTSNLDPHSREIFLNLLSDVTKDTTVILTSHRADELEFLSCRIIEMDYGKVISDSAKGGEV